MLGISRRPWSSLVPGGKGNPFSLSQWTLARSGPSSLQVKTTSCSKENERNLFTRIFNDRRIHAVVLKRAIFMKKFSSLLMYNIDYIIDFYTKLCYNCKVTWRIRSNELFTERVFPIFGSKYSFNKNLMNSTTVIKAKHSDMCNSLAWIRCVVLNSCSSKRVFKKDIWLVTSDSFSAHQKT